MSEPSLNLSANQEQQIREIFKSFREERQDLKNGDSETMQEEIRNARQETRQKLMAVLNDEQKKIFTDNLQKWKDQSS